MATARTLHQPSDTGYATVELDVEVDRAAMLALDEWAFSFAWAPETLEQLQFPLPAGRAVGIRHTASGELAALHGSYAFVLAVPGGEVPAAGLTWVGVHPGHRRRGLASAMLATHLARTAEREEPLSVLFAAEPEIYGRYGYGAAALNVRADLARGTALRAIAGTEDLTCSLERLDLVGHAAMLRDLLAASDRPGRIVPSPDLLHNLLVDTNERRQGAEASRVAVVRDREGTVRAFASLRRKEEWAEQRPVGTVVVSLAHAVDGAASSVLWRTLTDLDLMVSTRTPMLAVDDPLLAQLVNLRTAALRHSDNLWVRLVDLPRALASRRCASPVDVVLEVTDARLPANAGRWRLVGGPDGAEVRATTEPTALALDVAELGAAYLGGVSLASLAGAGLVREQVSGTLAATSTAFGWHRAPVCSWMF